MNKKTIIVIFIICILIFSVISQESDLAKYYLKVSFDFYKDDKFELAKINLEKGCGFNEKFPECYYISNLLLSDIKENMQLKKKNADLIIKYFNNSFFIEDYDLYKQIASVFENIKDFDKSIFYYNKLISIFNRIKEDDFSNYIKMLFKTKDKLKFDLIPSVIKIAKEKYDSLDYDYYLLLYKVNSKSINNDEFKRNINILEANNYSNSRIIYLKIIFYEDIKILNSLYDEYISLRNQNVIELEYKNKILFALLNKANYFSNQKILELLYDWDKIAQIDIKTIQLVNNKKISAIINSNEELKKRYLYFTGIRKRDDDQDNNWEEYNEYKNGVMVNKLIDENQDGIFEVEISYYNNKTINTYIIFGNSNDNYKKYYLNDKDQSLKYIEFYSNNKLEKRITFLPSIYKPDIRILKNIDYNLMIQNIAYIEEWNKEYIKMNYSDSNLNNKYIDSDNNGKFDKNIYFKGGIIDIVYKDINENGIYELFEKYFDGKLKYIEYMTDENYGNYDYKEEFNKNSTLKYWDYNKDKIYEVAIEEDNSGIVKKMFDINFNAKYDYIYEEKNGVLQKIYKINDKSNKIEKEILIEPQHPKFAKSKNWIVVTVKDPNLVNVPDDIIINDKEKISGIFYYNKEKIFFKNGIIKNEYFSYRLFLLNNVIYLIDLY